MAQIDITAALLQLNLTVIYSVAGRRSLVVLPAGLRGSDEKFKPANQPAKGAVAHFPYLIMLKLQVNPGQRQKKFCDRLAGGVLCLSCQRRQDRDVGIVEVCRFRF